MDINLKHLAKRALIITDVTAPGGVNTYVVDMVEFARSNGWELVVQMDNMPGSDLLYKSLLSKGAHIQRKGIYHRTNSIKKIEYAVLDTLRQYDPSIVHVVCGSPRSAIIPRKVAIDSNYPLFFTEQYVDSNVQFTSWQYEQVKSIYRRAFGIIAVCEENRCLLEDKYHLESKKLAVIPNSINLEKIVIRKKLRTKEFCSAICVGRLTPQKGYDILIQGVRLLDKHVRQCIKITILGDGPDKEMLENMVHEYDLNAQFEFLGWVSDVGERLVDYDLFVMPSRFEGQPFALIEAMAYGLPCIATAVSGIPELLNHGKNGTLTVPGNPQSISDALTGFINDPMPFFERVPVALDYVRENHNLSTNMKKLLDLWTSAITDKVHEDE